MNGNFCGNFSMHIVVYSRIKVEIPGSNFTDVFNADHSIRHIQARLLEAASWERFRAQQKRNVARYERVAVALTILGLSLCQCWDLWRRQTTTLNCCSQKRNELLAAIAIKTLLIEDLTFKQPCHVLFHYIVVKPSPPFSTHTTIVGANIK